MLAAAFSRRIDGRRPNRPHPRVPLRRGDSGKSSIPRIDRLLLGTGPPLQRHPVVDLEWRLRRELSGEQKRNGEAGRRAPILYARTATYDTHGAHRARNNPTKLTSSA
jgi:hypothetical protein